MKRGKPMKRTAFKRPTLEDVRANERVAPRRADWSSGWDNAPMPAGFAEAVRASRETSLHRGTYSGTLSGGLRSKESPLQNAAYMDVVRTLSCAHCGRHGPSQFCHSDLGKGMGLKSDCRGGWPGCGPHDGQIGCHALLGSTGELGKATRRRLEQEYAAQTRATVARLGLWPATLPRLP